MIITSAGKNIAPSNIENYLKESPLVGHALVFGEGRPYCVAVLTLDGEVAPQVARRNGIEFTDLADLARNPQVRALVQQSVDAANERLSRPEQVKRFELLPVEWTAESEEHQPSRGSVTPARDRGSPKRRVGHAHGPATAAPGSWSGLYSGTSTGRRWAASSARSVDRALPLSPTVHTRGPRGRPVAGDRAAARSSGWPARPSSIWSHW